MIKVNGLAKVYLAEESKSVEVWCRILDWEYGQDSVTVRVLDETGMESIKKGEYILVPMVLVMETLSEWLQ